MNAEHQQLEWKASWRDEHLKWVCAFANSEGGTLVIGRNDEGHAVGLPQARKLLEDLPNKVRDLLGVVVQVNLRTEGGHAVLELVTPAYPTPISYLRAVAPPRMAQATAPVIPQVSDPVSDLADAHQLPGPLLPAQRQHLAGAQGRRAGPLSVASPWPHLGWCTFAGRRGI